MGIFKLSRAESKKVFLRPGIFVVTFILIMVLTASAAIYIPILRQDARVAISGDSVGEIFNVFDDALGTKSSSQIKIYETYVESSYNFANSFTTASTSIETLISNYTDIYNTSTDYDSGRNAQVGESILNAYKLDLRTKIETLKSNYENFTENKYDLLVKKDEHTEFKNFLTNALSKIPEDNDADHYTIGTNLSSMNFIATINSYVHNLQAFNINEEVITNIINYYKTNIDTDLISIVNDIEELNIEKSASQEQEDIDAINTLINDYKLKARQYKYIATNAINYFGFAGFTNQQVNEFLGFEDLNLYEVKETLNKNLYLFENNTYDYNYANPFSINSTSNFEVNAFDFSYFTLEIFAFIIIIYCVVIGAGMIAGEEASGTMKLLALRPYKRHKIWFGKLFATLRIGFVLLLISSIVTLISGYIMFGIESMSILNIINAEYIFASSPYVALLAYLATLYFRIIFYSILALSISTIFRSHIGAVVISIITFVGSIVSTIILNVNGVTTLPFMKYVPFANTGLYSYFGGSLTSASGEGLDVILKSPIVLDGDLVFSIANIAITSLIFILLSLFLFKSRDLK